jgi:RNA binding exosome subunit
MASTTLCNRRFRTCQHRVRSQKQKAKEESVNISSVDDEIEMEIAVE